MKRNFVFSFGEYYHIYNRGVEKRNIFLDKKDYDRFVKLLYLSNSHKGYNFSDLSKSKSSSDFFEIDTGDNIVSIGAWCLMPNHFHILIKENLEDRPQDGGICGVSIFMKKVLTAYSMYFNRKYHRTGALFEGNFKAKHLNYDQYLKYQFAYIHLNPISIIDSGWKEKKISDKENAKEFLNDYKYSSYIDYLGFDRPEGKIINKNEFPEYFESSLEFSEMIDEWFNFENIENIEIS